MATKVCATYCWNGESWVPCANGVEFCHFVEGVSTGGGWGSMQANLPNIADFATQVRLQEFIDNGQAALPNLTYSEQTLQELAKLAQEANIPILQANFLVDALSLSTGQKRPAAYLRDSGDALQKAGLYQQALDTYQEIDEVVPNKNILSKAFRAELCLGQARILDKLGREMEANELFNQVVELTK